jgi:outer membrane receptor protein involved in Fe transport
VDDTGQTFTYYEYPSSLGSAAFSKTMITNNPAADANYKTFEVAVMKRPARGWQVGTSYSSTWIDVPISCGASGSGLGSGTPLIWFPTRCLTNPNQAFNTANNTREWQAKVSGAYNLPYGIVASANYDIRSSIALNVEPIGTFSLPNTHELDVRAAKRLALGGSRTVELRFDLYNALNKGTVTTQNLQSGTSYLRPATILFPRILQIGATFNF